MVASWVCDVTEIRTQRSTELCEDYIDITDIRYRHHCFFMTHLNYSFPCMLVNIV